MSGAEEKTSDSFAVIYLIVSRVCNNCMSIKAQSLFQAKKVPKVMDNP